MKGKYFIEPLFHAVIEGRKTMMREVVKPPKKAYGGIVVVKNHTGDIIDVCWADEHERFSDENGNNNVIKPCYKVGETVYLKEPYFEDYPFTDHATATYKYNMKREFLEKKPLIKWKTPITMPSKYARYFIEITSVCVEKLQDISELDAIAEGVDFLFTEEECKTTVGLIGTKPSDHGYRNYLWHGLVGNGITRKQSNNWDYQYSSYASAKDSYSSLMEKINGSGTWDANPFVWTYEFKIENKYNKK